MRRCLLLVVLAATLGFAPAPLPRPERGAGRDDLARMQGLWRMLSYESNGSSMGSHYKVRIKDNRWTFISTEGQERESASYDFNLAFHVTPRAFEWKSNPTANAGWVGSYKLESNRLTIVFSSGTLRTAEKRPTNFDGRSSYKIVLERIDF